MAYLAVALLAGYIAYRRGYRRGVRDGGAKTMGNIARREYWTMEVLHNIQAWLDQGLTPDQIEDHIRGEL